MKNAIIYLLVFLALQFGVVWGVEYCWHAVSGNNDISADMLITAMTLFSIITIAVFTLARWYQSDKSYMSKRPWVSITWCALAALGTIIPSIWLQEQMPDLPNLVGDEFTMIMKNPAGYIAIGLMAPIAEEVVFRGSILRALLSAFSNRWVAIVVSALLFSLAHGNPVQMPHAFVVGVLIGWMFYRTGSIAPGVVFHWVNNTIAFVACYIMPDPDIPLIVLLNGSGMRVAIAVVSSLLIFFPSLYQLYLRLGREKQHPLSRMRR